jgi:hypothetical protein
VDSAAEEVKDLLSRYRISKIVGDEGGLGKLFANELRSRHSISLEPAEKANKRGFQRLMNAALERGLLVAVAETCPELLDEWETLPLAADGETEAKGHPNHAADACLYAWRASRSYTAKPPVETPQPGTHAKEMVEESRLIREVELELKGGRASRGGRGWARRMMR